MSRGDNLKPTTIWLCDKIMIVAIQHRMQTPLDFVVVSTIVMISSLVDSGCGIRPKQHDNWEVIPNLWGGCVSPPSTLKSPSMNEAMKLIERLQAEYGEKFEQEKIGGVVMQWRIKPFRMTSKPSCQR
jgi:hypothetical protein